MSGKTHVDGVNALPDHSVCMLVTEYLSPCALGTYAAEDFGGQILVKLADDDSHVVVLETEKKKQKQSQGP